MTPKSLKSQTHQPRIKIHVLLIGLVLVALNSLWVLMGSEVWHSTQLTIASLFFNAVFTLLILVLINLAVQKLAPRLAMSQSDVLTIYAMVVMLTTISGHTMMGYLLPAIEHAFWFASPENEWEQLFGSHVPNWIAVRDRNVLQGFFQGESTLYTRNISAHGFRRCWPGRPSSLRFGWYCLHSACFCANSGRKTRSSVTRSCNSPSP